MLDWMMLVFRALQVSTSETFFLAVSILDKYLSAKSKENESLKKENLYLIGLVCIFIASKYEDIVGISMA